MMMLIRVLVRICYLDHLVQTVHMIHVRVLDRGPAGRVGVVRSCSPLESLAEVLGLESALLLYRISMAVGDCSVGFGKVGCSIELGDVN